MQNGGKRAGAGRKPGSLGRKTRAIAERAVNEGLTPLEVMLADMRDPKLSRAERFEAAKSAAPFMHPRLSTVDATVSDKTLPSVEAVEWVVVRPGELIGDDEATDVGSQRLN
jgi:hypothetical protein